MKGEINNNYCDFMNGQFETPPQLKRETIVTEVVLLDDLSIVYEIYKKRQLLSPKLQRVDVIGKIYFPKRKGKIRATKKWVKLIGDISLCGYPIKTIWEASQKSGVVLITDRRLIDTSVAIVDIEDEMINAMEDFIVREIQHCQYQYEREIHFLYG